MTWICNCIYDLLKPKPVLQLQNKNIIKHHSRRVVSKISQASPWILGGAQRQNLELSYCLKIIQNVSLTYSIYENLVNPNLRKIRISNIFVKKIRQIEGGSAILHFDEVFRLSHISTFFAKFMFKTCDIKMSPKKEPK